MEVKLIYKNEAWKIHGCHTHGSKCVLIQKRNVKLIALTLTFITRIPIRTFTNKQVLPYEKNKHHTTLGCFFNLHSSCLPRPSRRLTSTKYFYSSFEQRDLATYLSDKSLTSLPVLVEKGKKLDRKNPNLQVLISLHFTPESSNDMKLNNCLQQLGLQLVSLILVWKTNQNSPAIRLFCT
jgi:hypothetical protein